MTPRQREVLALVAAGRSNREIGAALGITEATVKCHLVRIYARLGSANRVAAAVWFLKDGEGEGRDERRY